MNQLSRVVLLLLFTLQLRAWPGNEDEARSLDELLIRIERDVHEPWGDSHLDKVFGFEDAIEAGPRLVKLLEVEPIHPLASEWLTKRAIAVCLGLIGYKPATPSLIQALDSENDWRLVLLAARSLGLLQAQDAVSRLRELEADHWYPPVREAASLARKVIERKADYLQVSYTHKPSRYIKTAEAALMNRLLYFGFFWGHSMPRTDEEIQVIIEERMRTGPLEYHYDRGPGALGSLGLWLSFYWNRPTSDDPHGRSGYRIPDHGIVYGSGLLLGKDNGEFGGELIYYAPFRAPKYLYRGGVAAIHRLGEKVLVFGGAGHGGFDTWIFEVVTGADGLPTLARWEVLPGGYHASGYNDKGQLEVIGFGSFYLDENRKMRMTTE